MSQCHFVFASCCVITRNVTNEKKYLKKFQYFTSTFAKLQLEPQEYFRSHYTKIVSVVQWDNYFSSYFVIKSGVRQGGVLLPILFNIYVDCLAESLRESDLGCHIHGVYFCCLPVSYTHLTLPTKRIV